jgi:uroporphyrinogen III methyltransferase / synthase
VNPLAGQLVVVTRPAGGKDELAEELGRLGATVEAVPLLELVDPESFAPLDEALANLTRYAAVAFTSANAVKRVAERLEAPIGPPLKVVAVGPKTAEALRARGLPVDAVPADHKGQALVALLEDLLGGLAGKRILLPRAEVADEALPKGVREAGGVIDVLPVYRTVIPPEASRRLSDALARHPRAIALASPSAASHLVELLGGNTAAAKALEGVILLALGESTRERLARHGLTDEVISAPPPAANLAQALVNRLRGVGG